MSVADWDELLALQSRGQAAHPRTGHRLRYSAEQLRWRLSSPEQDPTWLVEHREHGQLVGFVAALPQPLRVAGEVCPSVEVDLLCIDATLRGRGLGGALIDRVQERVEATGIFQALFFGECRRRHPLIRLTPCHTYLRVQELIDAEALQMADGVGIQRFIACFEQKGTSLPALRPMVPADVPAVTELFAAQPDGVARHWDANGVAHWLLPRPEVVDTWVLGQPATAVVSVSHVRLVRSVGPAPVRVARCWALAGPPEGAVAMVAGAVHRLRALGVHMLEGWRPGPWEAALDGLASIDSGAVCWALTERPIRSSGPVDANPR